MKRIFTIFITMLFLFASLSLSYAAVVYKSGNNIVKNEEKYQYRYYGYGQCQGSQIEDDYRCYQVYIRYSGGASGDTGRLYSDKTFDGTIESVSYTYTDTLNPYAPKTIFNYGFLKSKWNILPTSFESDENK